jgi:hypothetical protein
MVEDHLKELAAMLGEMKKENLQRHEEINRKHEETNRRIEEQQIYMEKRFEEQQIYMEGKLEIVTQENRTGLLMLEAQIESRRSSRAPSPPREGDEKKGSESLESMFQRRMSLEEPRLPPSFKEADRLHRTEKTKKRDSVMGSLLRFKEASSKSTENRLFVASDKHLEIVWQEKTIDGFLTFLEDIRDFQFNNDVEIKSIYGHIHRDIRDYIGTILKD